VLEVSVPVVLINGMQASADQLAHPALVNDGHFTAMQVRNGRVRGFAYHLVRLCSAHAELYGTVLDVEYLRAIIRRAVEHYPDASLRVNLYEALPGQPEVMTAIRPPAEADERAQSLLPVVYSRPFAHIKHVGSFAQIRYGMQANKRLATTMLSWSPRMEGSARAPSPTSDSSIATPLCGPKHPFCTASPGSCWIRLSASAGSRSAGDV
jgi:hypothetical protein